MSSEQAFYLDVPFRDKDIVKQLGARWDSTNKSWFVPVGVPIERFSRWHRSAGKALKSTVVNSTPGTQSALVGDVKDLGYRHGVSLSSVLFEVSEWVKKGWSKLQWVIAEVSDIKCSSAGHYYLELVEHDPQGRQIAKVNAKIWANQAKILKGFEKTTGIKVEKGIKVMFLANAEFSIQYGFSLTIEDFDTNWTLGEMEIQKRKIREKLQALGLWEKNKQLKIPKDFTKIAIIAPSGAAGLGDFLADSEKLESFGLCHFAIFYATFEGVASQASLRGAFEKIKESGTYDIVVLLRGGGATSSLNWLNDELVATCICECESPVFTGLGHQRDSTILDEISALSFDTPSKVIGFISNCIIENAQSALQSFEYIFSSAQLSVERAQSDCEKKMEQVYDIVQRSMVKVEQNIEHQIHWIFQMAEQKLQQVKVQNEQLLREILGLGPQKVLARGYAIVKRNEHVVGSAQEIAEGDALSIAFSDGTIDVSVNKVEQKSLWS